MTRIGWLAQAGVHFTIQTGLDLVVGGVYGANSLKAPSPETGNSKQFYGGLAEMFLRLGDPRRAGLHLFWGLGPMVRKFSAEDHGDRSGAITAGAGVSIPFASGEYFASGAYLGTPFDSALAVWTVSGGVRIRLGDSSRPDRAR